MINIRKIRIITLTLIILLILGKVVVEFIKVAPFDYDPLHDSGMRCNHLFQDSIRPTLHCFHSFGNADGAICGYTLLNKYRFMIWEVSKYRNVETKSIYFHNCTTIKEIDRSLTRTFEIGGNPTFQYADIMRFTAEKELNILAGGNGELKVDTITDNYLISSGQLSDLEFLNGWNAPQIHITYQSVPAYSVLLFVKKKETLFIILINSFENKNEPKEAIKYLKLE